MVRSIHFPQLPSFRVSRVECFSILLQVSSVVASHAEFLFFLCFEVNTVSDVLSSFVYSCILVSDMTCNVFGGTLNLTQPSTHSCMCLFDMWVATAKFKMYRSSAKFNIDFISYPNRG